MHKRGNVVTITFDNVILTKAVTGWGTTICRIPDEYAPKYGFYFHGTDGKVFYMTNGNAITSNQNLNIGDSLFFTITYVIG